MNEAQAATIAAGRRPRRLSPIAVAALAGLLLVYGMSALVGNTVQAAGSGDCADRPLGSPSVCGEGAGAAAGAGPLALRTADAAGAMEVTHLRRASRGEATAAGRALRPLPFVIPEPAQPVSGTQGPVARTSVAAPGSRLSPPPSVGLGRDDELVAATLASGRRVNPVAAEGRERPQRSLGIGVAPVEPMAGAGPLALRTADAAGALKDSARGEFANFLIHAEPQELPDFGFVDEAGQRHALSDFRGKLVLLNLWATWCGPCRQEMPAFDALTRDFGGRPFALLAISVDRGGLKKPRRFFDEVGIRDLTLYGDEDGRLASKLRSFAMPTTLLIGPDGRELGRLAGPAEWTSPDALAFLEAAMKQAGVGGKG